MGTRKRIPGIYRITNTVTGCVYVGSSVNVKVRKWRHFLDLEKTKHFNSKLQRSYSKYGSDAFTYEIVEYCDCDVLLEREQYWLDETKKTSRVYNTAPVTGSARGIKRSDETRRKQSLALRGKVLTAEHKEKLRLAKLGTHFRLGKKASDETRKRISESRKGKGIGNKNASGKKNESEDSIRKRIAAAWVTRKRNKELQKLPQP